MVDALTPRALLAAGPNDYVAERDGAAKAARAEGDRVTANALKALKRPSMSMWAVLVAGADELGVRRLMTATGQLATVQGAGGDRSALQEATAERRRLVEQLTDRAVAALAEHDRAAEAKRAEIRSTIDLLARHPELADAWLDGTLRDLPDAGGGFDAFEGMALPERPPRATPPAKAPAGPPRAAPTQDDREADRRAQQREAERREAERLEAERREAERRAAEHAAAVAAARARLAAAQSTLDEAERAVARAQQELDDLIG